jgi:hypothetical protein
MRKILIAAALALSAAALAPAAPANAQGVSVTIGSGGHHYRHYDRGYHRGWRSYGYAHCRTVVTTRWHHGRRVTVRRRVCG